MKNRSTQGKQQPQQNHKVLYVQGSGEYFATVKHSMDLMVQQRAAVTFLSIYWVHYAVPGTGLDAAGYGL